MRREGVGDLRAVREHVTEDRRTHEPAEGVIPQPVEAVLREEVRAQRQFLADHEEALVCPWPRPCSSQRVWKCWRARSLKPPTKSQFVTFSMLSMRMPSMWKSRIQRVRQASISLGCSSDRDADQLGGFYPIPLHVMDTPKRALGMRRLVALAYANESTPKWRKEKQSLPGPLFDAVVIGLFLVLGIGLLIH